MRRGKSPIFGSSEDFSEQSKKKRSTADDILSNLENIESQATDFILNNLVLPAGVEVVATSPIQTVRQVQVTADGSIAADCISGTCSCSTGFIDNGDGSCVENAENQVITTTAVTTTETSSVTEDNVTEWLSLLIEKMESVFENDRPEKGRRGLFKKWQKVSRKFKNKYLSLKQKGCSFSDTHGNNINDVTIVDFYTIDACRVRDLNFL